MLAIELAVRSGALASASALQRQVPGNHTLREAYARLEALRSVDPPAELIVLGSSRAYFGIDTPLLTDELRANGNDLSVFNGALMAGTPTMHRVLVETESYAFRDVRAVVLEVPFFALNSNPAADFHLETRAITHLIREGTARLPETTRWGRGLASVWWTYRDRTILRHTLHTLLSREVDESNDLNDRVAQLEETRGYDALHVEYAPVDVDDELRRRRSFYVEYQLEGPEQDALHALLQTWSAADVFTVVVRMPVTTALELYLAERYSAELAAWDAAVHAATRDGGATYIDLRPALPAENHQYFGDLNHLNAEGARRVTQYLAERLRNVELPSIARKGSGAEGA